MPPNFATYFSFSEFNHGVRVTLDQFRAELSKFNRLLVVYVCGVMNTIIRDWQGHTRLEAVEELVRNSFRPDVAERIVAEINNPQRPRGLYHRQQLLFVAKEALLVCPESGGNDPLAPAHSGEMARVLLMANDLLPKGLTGASPTVTQMINVMSEFIPIAEASGFQKPLNKILRSHIMIERFFPGGSGEIRSIFQSATGVSIDDYFALCFATLCRYVDLNFKKYQTDPSNFILAAGWFRTTPIDATIVLNFLKEISATVEEFKAALERRSTAVNDFTCFRGKPCVKDDANHLLIDPVFLAEKSDSGVFWSINQALSKERRLQFHQDWGLAFEKYVNWLMEESVDGQLNRVYPNPRFSDTGEEVCDAIVICGDSIIFVESKGATFKAEAKYGTDPTRLQEEIEEKFVESNGHRKGIGQLARRIEEVFDRRGPRMIEGIDVSRTTKAYPVLITRDDIGAALIMNAYLASRFRDLFHRKTVSVTVTPPFSLSAQDMEMLCAYLRDAALAELLEERYRAETSLLSSFWLVDNLVIQRLGNRDCKPFSDAMHAYFEAVKERLFPGLDISGFS
jgi:hypothetical protein